MENKKILMIIGIVGISLIGTSIAFFKPSSFMGSFLFWLGFPLIGFIPYYFSQNKKRTTKESKR